MTFSIVARCPEHGLLGVAVSTAVPAVGAMCPHVRPGVGAVSTQSWVNPQLAIAVLDLLQAGCTAHEALESALRADAHGHVRQIGLVTADGIALSWTGHSCTDWAGERTGPGYAIQGNMLTGAATLDAMQMAFLDSSGEPFEERLLQALEAGQRAGGDKRGRQSASLLIRDGEPCPYFDLRVDEHTDPVTELRRVFGVAVAQWLPFRASMPTRSNPAGMPPKNVSDMLMLAPSRRPGAALQPETKPSDLMPTDVLQKVCGTAFSPEHADANLAAFLPILAEIHKLREIDLGDTHPAVIFDPVASWRAR
jgi:uncharacterized Ntn-hydrolase superfamily protein